jgi:valyl-tRNA synthetase
VTPAGIEASVALGDVIDLDAERARLRRRLEAIDVDVRRSETKLADGAFTSKAPAAVVEKERSKLDAALEVRRKLEDQLRTLSG